MAITPEYHLRIDVKKYRELSEQQQMAYLLGALDLLCYTYLCAGDGHRARYVALDEFAEKLDASELRQVFLDYLDANDGLEMYSAAAIFFNALGSLSGFDK